MMTKNGVIASRNPRALTQNPAPTALTKMIEIPGQSSKMKKTHNYANWRGEPVTELLGGLHGMITHNLETTTGVYSTGNNGGAK